MMLVCDAAWDVAVCKLCSSVLLELCLVLLGAWQWPAIPTSAYQEKVFLPDHQELIL